MIASAGSAQGPPTTLNLLATSQKHVGFFPHHRPQGDRFGFGDKITGDDTGVDRGVCTLIDGKALCNVEADLSQGRLSLQGLLPQRANHTPVSVIGGTGNYDGAGGTATVTQVSQKKTDITVNLTP